MKRPRVMPDRQPTEGAFPPYEEAAALIDDLVSTTFFDDEDIEAEADGDADVDTRTSVRDNEGTSTEGP